MRTEFKATGQWIESKPHSTEGRWDVNYSTILTQLIKSVGKYCESYASDLFTDWQRIVRQLESGFPINETYIFAIRTNGVDHKEFYEVRKANPGMYGEPYHEVWQLNITTEDDKWIDMELKLIEN